MINKVTIEGRVRRVDTDDGWHYDVGKKKCDKIVDEMSKVGINWMC